MKINIIKKVLLLDSKLNLKKFIALLMKQYVENSIKMIKNKSSLKNGKR